MIFKSQPHSKPHIKLDNFWPYQAVVLADQISRHTLALVKSEAGLNLSQWRVLAAVADRPGRTAAEVTAVTPMDKTIVSRAVKSLIDSGLIKKTPQKDDKRRASLEMTRAGRASYVAIAGKLNAILVAPFQDDAPPEEFVKMLKTYGARLPSTPPET